MLCCYVQEVKARGSEALELELPFDEVGWGSGSEQKSVNGALDRDALAGSHAARSQ